MVRPVNVRAGGGSRPPPNIKLPSQHAAPLDEDDETSVMSRQSFESARGFPAASRADKPAVTASPRPAAGRPAQPAPNRMPPAERPHMEETALLPEGSKPRARSQTGSLSRDVPKSQQTAPFGAQVDPRHPRGGRHAAKAEPRRPPANPPRSPSVNPPRGPAVSVPPLDALLPRVRSETAPSMGAPTRSPSQRPRAITSPPPPQRSNQPVSFPPPPNRKMVAEPRERSSTSWPPPEMPEETQAMPRLPPAGVPHGYGAAPVAAPVPPTQHARHPSMPPPPFAHNVQSGATVPTIGPPVGRPVASIPLPPVRSVFPAAVHQPRPADPTVPTRRAPSTLDFLLFAAPLAFATAAIAAIALL